MRMSDNPTRNPSPPPLTEEEAEKVSGDFIKDTLFSKRWVLDLMVRLCKHDQTTIYKNETEEEEEKENEESVEKSLNSEFENDICQLWDMTANTEVAVFLYENECKAVFEHTLQETLSPRLMEICFGIIGNLFCVKEIRISFSESEQFRRKMLGYLTITDALSLVELTRVLCTVLSCTSSSNLWLLDICDDSACADQLVYLLGNSLNTDLLTHIMEIIDIVFDFDDEIIDRVVGMELLVGITEALCLLKEKEKLDSLVTLTHIMQTITSSNKGREILQTNIDKLINFLRTCIEIFVSKDSMELSSRGHLVFYASVFSCFTSMLSEHRHLLLALLESHLVFLRIFIDYLHKELMEISEGEKGTESSVCLISCIEALSVIIETSLASDYQDLKTYILSDDIKNILLQNIEDLIDGIPDLKEVKMIATSMKNLLQ